MEMIHNQKLEQQLALTQEMLTSLSILEYSGTELLDYLLEESQSNPALDSDEAIIQSDRLCESLEFIRVSSLSEASAPMEVDDDSSFEQTLVREDTLQDHLIWQLRTMQLDGTLCSAALWIVQNLDEDGYLREFAPPADDLAIFSEALSIVQSLDPAGIGASDLAECLILQLRRLGKSSETLEAIIREDLVALSQWRFAEIDQKYGFTGSEAVLELIRELNPRPSAGFSAGVPVNYVIPEITYLIHETSTGQIIETQLNNELIPKITVSPRYLDLIKNADPADEPALLLYVQRLHGIIDAIEKRNTTLLRVGQAIAAKQENLILGGSASPAPLTMKAIAEELELNISTVSRCIRGKYVRVRDRVIPLKSFFQTGLAGTDSDVSQSRALEVLKNFIETEEKSDPLSDEKLAVLLNEQGIPIKRRTVAKYRGLLDIDSAAARKRKAKFDARS